MKRFHLKTFLGFFFVSSLIGFQLRGMILFENNRITAVSLISIRRLFTHLQRDRSPPVCRRARRRRSPASDRHIKIKSAPQSLENEMGKNCFAFHEVENDLRGRRSDTRWFGIKAASISSRLNGDVRPEHLGLFAIVTSREIARGETFKINKNLFLINCCCCLGFEDSRTSTFLWRQLHSKMNGKIFQILNGRRCAVPRMNVVKAWTIGSWTYAFERRRGRLDEVISCLGETISRASVHDPSWRSPATSH